MGVALNGLLVSVWIYYWFSLCFVRRALQEKQEVWIGHLKQNQYTLSPFEIRAVFN